MRYCNNLINIEINHPDIQVSQRRSSTEHPWQFIEEWFRFWGRRFFALYLHLIKREIHICSRLGGRVINQHFLLLGLYTSLVFYFWFQLHCGNWIQTKESEFGKDSHLEIVGGESPLVDIIVGDAKLLEVSDNEIMLLDCLWLLLKKYNR